MQHPLVQSCLEISRAGYEKRNDFYPAWHNRRLAVLASYLLNGSKLGMVFHPKPIPLGFTSPEMEKSLAIMFGGGIDSFEAFIMAVKQGLQIRMVHTNYGQPYWELEHQVFQAIRMAWEQVAPRPGYESFKPELRAFVSKLAKEHNKEQVTFHSEHVELVTEEDRKSKDFGWKNYIFPGRNLVLAAIGSAYAPRVWIVANKRSDEAVGTPDKTSRFYREASSIFSEFYGYPIKVESPFLHLSKKEATVEYVAHGGDLAALSQTFSCYTPAKDGRHCGVCYSCYKRHQLFQGYNFEHDFADNPQHGPNYHTFEETEKAKGRE